MTLNQTKKRKTPTMAFDLSSIHRGFSSAPPRVVVYGDHGVGKSTFATCAPKAIVIQTEDGLGSLDCASFPFAQSKGDVMAAIKTLYAESDHGFETVVLDSLDWLEALIWKHVVDTKGKQSKDKIESIEDFGYGKGYAFAADEMRHVLSGLNALRTERGMNVVLTAHAAIKRYDDPTNAAYDRFAMKLHKHAGAIVQEWADVVGFAQIKTTVRQEDAGFGKKTSKGLSTGERVLHTQRAAAFDAKNRYDLPAVMPLDWGALSAAIKGGK